MPRAEREDLRLKGKIHRFYGQDYVDRKLTPREFARLQGFPDDSILDEHRSVAWKQLGNSVPVPVVSWIVKALGEQFLNGNEPVAVQVRDKVDNDQGATLAKELELLRSIRETQEREIESCIERIGKLYIK